MPCSLCLSQVRKRRSGADIGMIIAQQSDRVGMDRVLMNGVATVT